MDIKSFLQPESELSQLFLKHKVGTDIAIELLHRHFEVPADKRLVRVGRVVTPWSASLFSTVEQQAGLGRLAPGGILVHDGAYYPYEFRHLSKSDAAAEVESSGGKDRPDQHATFLEQFARFVQDKNIANVIGLRFLSAEEKRRVEDPTIHDYEVTDDGCHMTVLSTDAPIEVMGYEEFSWAMVGGGWAVVSTCYGGLFIPCSCTSGEKKCSMCISTCFCAPLVDGHKQNRHPCKCAGKWPDVDLPKSDCC